MGIPSLKSAILYCVGLYFHIVISSERRESRDLNHANITNIPYPGHKKGLFSGRHSHFAIPGQENG